MLGICSIGIRLWVTARTGGSLLVLHTNHNSPFLTHAPPPFRHHCAEQPEGATTERPVRRDVDDPIYETRAHDEPFCNELHVWADTHPPVEDKD